MSNLSPEQSPQVWLCVNVLCFLSSLALFIDLLIARDDALERPYASAYYLLWTFVTTAIWCIEIGLTAADEKRRQQLSFQTKIELLLALGFLADASHLLYVWKITDKDVGGGKILDASVGVLAYGFLIYQNYSTMKERRENEAICIPFKDDEERNIEFIEEEFRYGAIVQ